VRKLIVCNIISLDGLFSGPGGDVMAMPFDGGFSDYNAERLRATRRVRAFENPASRLAPSAGQPQIRRLEPAPGPVCRRAMTGTRARGGREGCPRRSHDDKGPS
jgi:hypothetical protein